MEAAREVMVRSGEYARAYVLDAATWQGPIRRADLLAMLGPKILREAEERAWERWP